MIFKIIFVFAVIAGGKGSVNKFILVNLYLIFICSGSCESKMSQTKPSLQWLHPGLSFDVCQYEWHD